MQLSHLENDKWQLLQKQLEFDINAFRVFKSKLESAATHVHHAKVEWRKQCREEAQSWVSSWLAKKAEVLLFDDKQEGSLLAQVQQVVPQLLKNAGLNKSSAAPCSWHLFLHLCGGLSCSNNWVPRVFLLAMSGNPGLAELVSACDQLTEDAGTAEFVFHAGHLRVSQQLGRADDPDFPLQETSGTLVGTLDARLRKTPGTSAPWFTRCEFAGLAATGPSPTARKTLRARQSAKKRMSSASAGRTANCSQRCGLQKLTKCQA